MMLSVAGVSVNMVLFEKSVLRQTNAEAANSFSIWVGTSYIFGLFGALLSDSSLGRFFTCIFTEAFLVLGVIALTLITQFLLLKPQGCGTLASQCDPASPFEETIYYISIYMIAFGIGAAEPALAALGADQFDEEDPDEKQSKNSFYSYFYVAWTLGCLVAETGLAYVYSLGHWILGLWLCTLASLVAYLLLLSPALKYRHFKPPSGNPASRFSQVIVASVRKKIMSNEVPVDDQELYHQPLHERGDASNRRILRTNDFRFLDRAAMVSLEDLDRRSQGVPPNPWRLCTVTQVEEAKCILRLIPIWLCSIPSSLVFVQAMSLFLEQGTTMNTKVGKTTFDFPPASMPVFDMATTSTFILLYRQLILPLYVKLTKREATPKPLNELFKIEIGLAFGIASMLVAGITEQARLRHAVKDTTSSEDTSSLSIFWLAPQYILVGVSEALVTVAQMDFFSAQSPDAMKSFGVGLSMVSTALGNYFNSLLLTVVMKITPHPGWVPPNLNQGHLDRFYFLSAAILLFDLGIFVVVAKKFKPISLEKR
ncbi:Protein NRT1/ PTR FAMILY 7.3 [Linum grandiflorum]